ncbi:MAG: hypothetical protein M1319_01825, partial [Chloroflexi bacterium]|nr:hypothetical protein [Chloroflexota bacterium]
MAQLSEILRDNTVAVFFIYGLAFFSTGLIVVLEARRAPIPGVSRSMLPLAAFGLLQSALAWTDMFISLRSAGLQTAQTPLDVLRLIWLVASALALLQFASYLIQEVDERHTWLRWSASAALAAWVIVSALSAVVGLSDAHQLLIDMDAWARYLMMFPGSVLAALSLFRLGRDLSGSNPGQFTHGARSASVAFAFNAIIAGLIVPKTGFWPASVLNYDFFLNATGIPFRVV